MDIVVSSLLAHHLEDEEIVALLRRMEATVQLGWFINDLERAQWSYRMFGMVRWHPIVRHDGPVSFRRAFRKEDWVRLLAAADVPREGGDGRTLAAGSVVRGAVEVRSVI